MQSGHTQSDARQRREEMNQDVLRKIGAKLREARLERKLTLEQVASAAGLTKGFLSQLERGESAASVSSLLSLCSVLRLGIAGLLEFATSQGAWDPMVRRSDRVSMYLGGAGVSDELLSPPHDRRFEVFETHIEPLGTPGDEPYSLEADFGFAVVLQGRLEFLAGATTYNLRKGDALTYAPREPHTFRNPSESRETVVLFVKSPAVF